MTNTWVGTFVTALLALSMLGTGVSAPHPDFKVDDFIAGGAQTWELIDGDMDFEEVWSTAGDPLSWLVLADGDDSLGAAPSRARALASEVNTSLTSYMIHAIMERDSTFVAPEDGSPAPGAIGITFGESAGGHYTALFADDYFALASPDGVGGTIIGHFQNDWGTVPSWVDNVDDRHRYSLLLAGTTLSVRIDGWNLGSFTLPSVPAGTYGLLAEDDTRLYSEQIVYGPLDVSGPSIDLLYPEDSTLYIGDEAIPIPATGFIAAAGVLTIGANITDDVIGTKAARLYVDGRLVPGSGVSEPGNDITWALDLAFLSAGFHTFTVEAVDWAGNIAQNETQVFVIGAGAPDAHTTSTLSSLLAEVESLVPA